MTKLSKNAVQILALYQTMHEHQTLKGTIDQGWSMSGYKGRMEV